MMLRIQVNRATFARILSGEQTEVYLPDNTRNRHKLTNRRSGKLFRVQSLTLATRFHAPDSIIKAFCAPYTVGAANTDWVSNPKKQYFRFPILRFDHILPPYNPLVFRESVRNSLK